MADNIAFTKKNLLKKNLPGVNMVEHEGTYLIWLDFNGLGLCAQELEDLIVHKAKLWLRQWKNFWKMRKRIPADQRGVSAKYVKEALERIAEVLPADTVKAAS